MIHTGDCVTVMRTMPPDSVDAVVTDPPYGLEFMGRDWDRLSTDPDVGKARKAGFDATNGKRDNRPGNEGGTWFWSRESSTPNYYRTTNAKCRNCGKWRVSGGHDGKGNTLGCKCEKPDFPNVVLEASKRMQEWHYAWATEALRVTRPGGYMLAFGGTRTHHRLVCGLEDAGWIIRDELTWVYASGFPKGRANLKPAHEPIVLARKPGPLRPLNIEECRIGTDQAWRYPNGPKGNTEYSTIYGGGNGLPRMEEPREGPSGRWPSNLLLQDPALFDEPNPYVVGSGAVASVNPAGVFGQQQVNQPSDTAAPFAVRREGDGIFGYGDTGGYSRFFIVPKADRGDREPTVRGGGAEAGARLNAHPT